MGDPLSVLRGFVSSGRKWDVQGEEIVFGDVRFKKDEETAWKPIGRPGYYNLMELVIMIDHAHLPWNQYLKKIGGVLKQQTFVGRLDYNDLLKYLRGETATSKQIDQGRLISRAALVTPSVGTGGPLKRPAVGQRLASTFDGDDLHLREVSRSTGLDAQALGELRVLLETKRRRLEEGAREEELFKVDEEMHRILKADEQLLNDRNTALLTPTADYRVALNTVEATLKRAKDLSGKSGTSRVRSSVLENRAVGREEGPSSGGRSSSRGSRLHPPIIIVPSDPSALVNMTNVVDLLENAKFVGPQDRGKSKDGLKRVKELSITKVLDGGPRPVRFRVVDNPVWLQEQEWASVVAVFSNGKAWQFADWKHNTPVDLFHGCFGAVLIFDDEPVRGEVKGWNVKFYKINKNKRHMDGIAISSFWNQLTGWLKLNKPWVLEPPAVSGRKK